MKTIRIGTRRSDLARRQTDIVAGLLRRAHPSIALEIVPMSTRGDDEPTRPVDAAWPVGAFVTTIERALLAGEIDVAVHSYKDLPAPIADGLHIAATPTRGPVHDVLLTDRAVDLAALPEGLIIGTSSPRRTAQIMRTGPVRVVPIRGNVPTRIALIGAVVNGVLLGAAGVDRLKIEHPHRIDLPIERFPTAPGQGAIAVQTRSDDEDVTKLIASIDDTATARCVAAERVFMQHAGDICTTPIAATAHLESDGLIELHGQLLSPDGTTLTECRERGGDPVELGERVGREVRAGT